MQVMTVNEFIALCEEKLALASNGDLSQAPVPLCGTEAEAYLLGRADVLQWAIEMLAPLSIPISV